MGLFDRFSKPKWQHKDWKKRLEAVNELNSISDMDTLFEIAINDENEEVATKAIQKIQVKRHLNEIATKASNEKVRDAAKNKYDKIIEEEKEQEEKANKYSKKYAIIFKEAWEAGDFERVRLIKDEWNTVDGMTKNYRYAELMYNFKIRTTSSMDEKSCETFLRLSRAEFDEIQRTNPRSPSDDAIDQWFNDMTKLLLFMN